MKFEQISLKLNRQRVRSTRRLLVLCCVVVVPAFAWAQAMKNDPPPAATTVRLVIDYQDGVEKHFTAIPWKAGMTVMDAMAAAKASPRGITYSTTGSGETTFVTQIDDLKNEGARGGKRNWTYRVNDTLADRSAAVYGLKAGDRVCWSFTTRKM